MTTVFGRQKVTIVTGEGDVSDIPVEKIYRKARSISGVDSDSYILTLVLKCSDISGDVRYTKTRIMISLVESVKKSRHVLNVDGELLMIEGRIATIQKNGITNWKKVKLIENDYVLVVEEEGSRYVKCSTEVTTPKEKCYMLQGLPIGTLVENIPVYVDKFSTRDDIIAYNKVAYKQPPTDEVDLDVKSMNTTKNKKSKHSKSKYYKY